MTSRDDEWSLKMQVQQLRSILHLMIFLIEPIKILHLIVISFSRFTWNLGKTGFIFFRINLICLSRIIMVFYFSFILDIVNEFHWIMYDLFFSSYSGTHWTVEWLSESEITWLTSTQSLVSVLMWEQSHPPVTCAHSRPQVKYFWKSDFNTTPSPSSEIILARNERSLV